MAEYLNTAIEDGHPAVLLKALRNVADSTGVMAHLSRETGLTRESLYKALSEDGNPRLSSLDAILRAMGLQLNIKSLSPDTAHDEALQDGLTLHGQNTEAHRSSCIYGFWNSALPLRCRRVWCMRITYAHTPYETDRGYQPYERFLRYQCPKKAANVSINSDLLQQAKILEINLLANLEAELAHLIRQKRRAQWLDDNRPALDAYNALVEKHGVFSDGQRQF